MSNDWPRNDPKFANLEEEISGNHPKGLQGFLEELEIAGGSSQCVVTWQVGEIAYRCKTCQTNEARCLIYLNLFIKFIC